MVKSVIDAAITRTVESVRDSEVCCLCVGEDREVGEEWKGDGNGGMMVKRIVRE